MPLTPGARLGPYEILSPLGSGGMGEVYRARDSRLSRDVAVKVLHTDVGTSPDLLARFEHEARAVAALNHPHILALFDIGNESGVVYAVTELLEGETLRDRLDRGGRLAPAKAIDFAIQIARGLAAAHDRGFIHRDLKPANIFITQEGRVKILDFGLAQQTQAHPGWDGDSTRLTTGQGIVVGTPGYISPEQMLGEPATARSDLFAFGVVVHEMLTGAHPFVRASSAEMAMAVVREDPPALRASVSGLSAGTAAMLDRCLAKHAADRPGSARDLAIYLEAVSGAAGDEPSPATPMTTGESRRLRVRLLTISCALLVLLPALAWGIVRSMADRAVTASIDADLSGAEHVVRRVQIDRLAALSLTARLVASFPELKALFATDAATVRDYLVSYQQRNPGAPLLVALAPDGKLIARTDTPAAGDDGWTAAVLEGEGEPRVVRIGARPYHAAAAVADAGGNVFGHVVAAMPVDQVFAAPLRDATQNEVVLLSDTVLASTLRSGQTPWNSREDWRRAGGRADRAIDVTVGTQRFAAREVLLAEQPPVSAVILKSRDEATAPFRRMLDTIAILGAVGAIVAVGGSIWAGRVLARGLQRR